MQAKRKVPVYCAMSVHVKEPQMVEICGALHYGVSHSLGCFETMNPMHQLTHHAPLQYYVHVALRAAGGLLLPSSLSSVAHIALRGLGTLGLLLAARIGCGRRDYRVVKLTALIKRNLFIVERSTLRPVADWFEQVDGEPCPGRDSGDAHEPLLDAKRSLPNPIICNVRRSMALIRRARHVMRWWRS